MENVKYYPVREDAARRAKNANSYFDYVEGSATAEYRRLVDNAAAIAERQKERVGTEYHEKIDRLLDAYARKLADNLNHRYEIDARVPSILITGGSNFPVRAKEKQNAARDTNEREYMEIQGLLDKIKSTGLGGVMSDDPDAMLKLQLKLEGLERLQEHMKEINAYYRKHKTLDGCPDRRPDEFGPFPSWALSNNNANIRRIRGRIEQLQKEAQRAAENVGCEYVGDGFVLKEKHEIGRIQFIFDGKPDEKIRAILKGRGFRWAPSEGAWQRMLNDHGRYAAEMAIEEMTALKEA